MITIIREMFRDLNILGLGAAVTPNADIMMYFRSEYKNHAVGAYEYFQSTGQFDFRN
jgi:hypothetical protein